MSNIIKSMAETSYQYWLLGIPLILIIAHLTFKYLDFKTSKTEPKNLPKQYKLNKFIIISFLITFIVYFLSYPAYLTYLSHNFKNQVSWFKQDDQIAFISHNPILKSKTFKIEVEKPFYFILNNNDTTIIKLEKYELEPIEEITKFEMNNITPMDIIHYLENRNK